MVRIRVTLTKRQYDVLRYALDMAVEQAEQIARVQVASRRTLSRVEVEQRDSAEAELCELNAVKAELKRQYPTYMLRYGRKQ